MTQALPTTTDAAPESPIDTFRRVYAEAFSDAEVAARHTATEGWGRLWAAHHDDVRDARRLVGKATHALADQMQDFGWTEDDEKAMKELAKRSADLRARAAAFRTEIVERIEQAVTTCQRVIEDFHRSARRAEEDAPLLNAGAADRAHAETARVPKARWNAIDGVVEIVPPD